MSFVHLHLHTEYSLLDGFSNIKKVVARSKELEMPALAITDHGTMFGVIDFFRAAKEFKIKPIVGVEAYLAPRSMGSRDPQLDKKATHLLLLAENMIGYQNLLQISSIAQLKGFYYNPRIDHEVLASHAEGLIVTSGCMSAEIPRLIVQGNLEGAQRKMEWYFDLFGRERFFLELQRHDIKELDQINLALVEMGKRYNAQFLATNDVHYINQEDARLQDIMLSIQTGALLSDPNRMRMTNASYYLRSPQEMRSLFRDFPQACDNTLMVAERCNVDLGFKGYHLPQFEVPQGTTAESYLRGLCLTGLERRYGSHAGDEVVQKRLNYELEIIHSMGFDTYFLIVWDLCQHASQNGIWYNARGSAAGSIVAYCLDITMVDPIEHGLFFERFLNPGRISMPDIDLDFQDDRRAQMMEYTTRKYGDDKVAQIITFGTLGARAAIRDVGRVMDIPLSEVDKIAKLIPNVPGKPVTIEQALEDVTEFKEAYKSTPYLRELIDNANKVEGVVRNAGTHAAGVVITDRPIQDYIPIHRPTGNTQGDSSPVKTVTQFEMAIIEYLGLLKVDFLGLATLTIMAQACDLIEKRRGVRLNLYNIPTDDPAVYDLMGKGETAGVFQVEGSGMRRWLIQMKPRELANVIAMVALFRPGPMDFIPGYIARMHGEETVAYKHPSLAPIFGETYGFPVYQEQLMFAAMNLAGYEAPEADELRKAISKKNKEKLLQHREKFVQGAVKNTIPEETAGAIFDEWEEFARYGFNKSHAVDYGVIAVQTAYLKLHYTVEYMTALLSVSKNDTAKVALYVADCRRMGIEVGAPEINCSAWDFTIEDRPGEQPLIRFGLGAVKNVGQGAVETILEARKTGEFRDLNDLARRVDLRQVGRRALESLVKVGACDRFGGRSEILEAIDRLISVSTSHFRAIEAGQMSMFGAHTGVEENIVLPKALGEINRREILNWERELIGLYVSDHPLSPVMGVLSQVITHYSGQLSEAGPEERVRVAGIVTRIRHYQSKAGKPMGFVTIEDLQGSVELVVFPRVWQRVESMLDFEKIVLVDGRVDLDGAEPKIIVDNISTEFNLVVAANAAPVSTPEAPFENGYPPAPPARQRVADGKGARMQPNGNPADARGSEVHPVEPERATEKGKGGDWGDDVPPPPDEFPQDWVGFEPMVSVLRTAPVSFSAPDVAKTEKLAVSAPETPARQITPAAAETPAQVGAPEIPIQRAARPEALPDVFSPVVEIKPVEEALPPLSPPQYLVAPVKETNSSEKGIRMLTILFRSTDDKARDVLRLRRIYGIITSYPGEDRFAFHVFERGRGFLLEFPNFTTGICNEMLVRVRGLVGADNLKIEPITIL